MHLSEGQDVLLVKHSLTINGDKGSGHGEPISGVWTPIMRRSEAREPY